MTKTADDLLIVGRIRKAHGIRGEVVVELITDMPDAVFAAGARVFAGTTTGELLPDRAALHVVSASAFKGGLIVRFREIEERTAAELWRDRYLLVPASELVPPGDNEVYVHELIDMRVLLSSGEELGRVLDVYELPQGLTLDVQLRGRATVMLPFNARVVVGVDRASRTITVDPPPGMLD